MPLAVRRFFLSVGLTIAVIAAAGSLHAQTAPAITTQPAAKTVSAGAATTFTVVASGTTPAYQWLFNGNAISGATAASYAISSVTAAQAGGYSVTVSNSAGTVTSNSVNLLVYTPYVTRTLAGQVGVPGFADGTGNAALLNHPDGMACDLSGNLYIADTVNSVIRKMTSAGAVSIFAGQVGVPGAADGLGTAAQFNYPVGLAVDSSGNVYVADTENSTIRKITPAGQVSTLAGVAPTAANPAPTNQGSTNATGTAAKFQTPHGVAVDGSGNVYVADTQNSLIRKITPAGVVTTVAGNTGVTPTSKDGVGTAAVFDYPWGIVSDKNGNLWVADTSGNCIRAITVSGSVYTVTTLTGLLGSAGSAGGTGNVARFNQPTSIALDTSGNLFVADYSNSTVREILPGGTVVTLAGLAGNVGSADGSGTNARFQNAVGVTVDFNGNIYVADTENSTIRVGSAQSPTDVSPAILLQPVNQTASTGATVSFSTSASGTPAPTYQWQKNGANLAGATSSSLTLSNITPADGATYDVVVSNQDGSVTSTVVTLTVLSPPTIPTGGQSQSAVAGGAATFTANSTGGNLTYQWFVNGISIAGATASTLTINPVGTYAAGTYSVNITNSLGTATGTIGTLTVTASARLLNLSARGPASLANSLSAGFITSPNTSAGTKAILVRGIGPALAGFGVSGTLATPQLALMSASGTVATSNAGWSATSAQVATLTQVSSQVGAFPLTAGSQDQAVFEAALTGGSYSAVVTGLGTSSGQALAEIYDADTGTPTARLINLSARANVGTGANILTGGFVVAGTTSESVLLRAIGPTLGTAFSISGALAKPVLTLYNASSQVLGTNSAWGGSAAMSAIFTSVGAFALPTASSDAALVTALPPGNYTVQVAGANNTTGTALVEIYEIPAH